MLASLLCTLALAALVACASTSKKQVKRQGLAQIITKCTKLNTAALTFDDGPFLYLRNITDTLSAANATGTFFFNGLNYDCIYDSLVMASVKYAFGKGHQIASHTWSHPDLTLLTSDEINTEMENIELALQRIVGVTPAFLRPPFGNYNDLVQEVAFSRNQSLVLWDFDSGDSLNATVAQSDTAYDTLIATKPLSILALNHEVYQTTAFQLLPYAITKLQAAGYALVSLAECLDMDPYQSVGPAATPDPTWTC